VAFSERSASQKLRKEGKERKKGEQDGGLKKVTGMVAKVLHKAEDGLMRKFEGAEEKLEEMVFGTDSDDEIDYHPHHIKDHYRDQVLQGALGADWLVHHRYPLDTLLL